MNLLVTGGAGFIGSAFVRNVLHGSTHTVVNVDKLTYAAVPGSLNDAEMNARHQFVELDICDEKSILEVMSRSDCDVVVHFAAETHVDRSIEDSGDFVLTNVMGTVRLLSAALSYWQGLGDRRRGAFKFVHVSTDETYGPADACQVFNELAPMKPSSPYAASKASADLFVGAWARTYGFPVIICRLSNNYGPYQFPEKLIPRSIIRGLTGESIEIYGDGRQIRDWVFVDDQALGLLSVAENGRSGSVYNFAGHAERANVDLVNAICVSLDELAPNSPNVPHAELIKFVEDRPGHDARYAIDDSIAALELGWRPGTDFSSGLSKTVQWYLDNRWWWEPIMTEQYDGSRLGLARARP